jgi:hypothetical protein
MKRTKIHKQQFFFLAMLMVPLYGMVGITYAEEQANSKNHDVWITVFVHGMMSIKHHLSFENICRFLRDDVERTRYGDPTIYAATVKIMHHDPFFYQNQAMQGPGLQSIDSSVHRGNASGALAFLYDEMASHIAPNQKNYYCTFGWLGLLSAKTRLQEAGVLYKELRKIKRRFAQKGINPKFRIIGYSHGGNLGLNLHAVQRRVPARERIIIDELVLVGTPVQAETEKMIYSPLFKKIYNLYSLKDRVQIADPFSTGRFLSGRVFQSPGHRPLPAKLVQIQVKVTRILENHLHSPHCTNFCSLRTLRGKSGIFRDISPGHAELWFFGWTPLNYRSHFPLYPFPIVAFVPLIIKECTLHCQKRKNTPVVCDFRPQQNALLIRYQGSSCLLKCVPLIINTQGIKKQLFRFAPDGDYSEEIYRNHIHSAYKKAVICLTECLPNGSHRKRKFRAERRKMKNACGALWSAVGLCRRTIFN